MLKPQVHWYAVHTKPRQEQRALTNLQQQGYSCFLPTLTVQKLRQGKLATLQEPLFSRYLFIELDSGQSGKSWGPIRSTLGVSRLVSFGAEPAKISADLVQVLQQQNATQQSQTQPLFESGQAVQITQGPFAGLNAVYQMADGECRAMVLIEILSKQCRLAVPPAHLLKAA
jgi:transcriptional antiterminator RfaH